MGSLSVRPFSNESDLPHDELKLKSFSRLPLGWRRSFEVSKRILRDVFHRIEESEFVAKNRGQLYCVEGTKCPQGTIYDRGQVTVVLVMEVVKDAVEAVDGFSDETGISRENSVVDKVKVVQLKISTNVVSLLFDDIVQRSCKVFKYNPLDAIRKEKRRKNEKERRLRFVSESLPRLISGADGSDSLPQTLVVVTKPTRLVRTHPSGVPHTLLLNVEDR
ncbi:hypothetical protein WN51_10290 [Melipona quadrifasciata]|uniref:Uncharacterized protein n=1 Tax=Melipona quadrifasciata TaxID=166423 RepID=A0A0M9A4Q7_9HYME|nr:hypothetical protein WN51_10290 [Melipona quadrifasciata]